LQHENDERARVRVSGKVQGVFFRDSTREKASSLNLDGWVRNLPDGRVEAVFEGPSEKVREMVEWCRSGPPQADVEEVEADYEPPEDDLSGFEVR
jgi:acylphosphatase